MSAASDPGGLASLNTGCSLLRPVSSSALAGLWRARVTQIQGIFPLWTQVCTGGSRKASVDEQSLSLVKLMARAEAPAGLPARHPHLQS